MYVLYLDDSGGVTNPRESYFVLGGVAVPEQSIRWLSSELENLAQSLNPDDPRKVEFHASEIFSRRTNVWKMLQDKDGSIKTIQRVLQCLNKANSDVVLFACAVHKDSYPGVDPVAKAFEDISSRFNKFLERRSTEKSLARGMIVLDKSTYEQNIQKLAIDFRRDGNRWGSQLRQICEVPFFVDSDASRIIQLADHIAYAVFRRYNADDLTYFKHIESRFDKEAEGRVFGLAHLQTKDPNCMCSACYGRRLTSSRSQST